MHAIVILHKAFGSPPNLEQFGNFQNYNYVEQGPDLRDLRQFGGRGRYFLGIYDLLNWTTETGNDRDL